MIINNTGKHSIGSSGSSSTVYTVVAIYKQTVLI